MRIAFIGQSSGTSGHRIRALGRLGHEVVVLTPEKLLPQSYPLRKLHYETGGLFVQKRVARELMAKLGDQRFDLAWVDSGRYVGPQLVRDLKKRGCFVLNHNNDDPFGYRDRFSWQTYLRAVPEYDLLLVFREPNIQEAMAKGAKRVIRVQRTADEVAHAPRDITPTDIEKWGAEVSFVGTYMKERGPFIERLLELGVPVSVFGPRWERAYMWPKVRKAWRGATTCNDDDYARSIQCAKICLGLVSTGNRDEATRRSVEVPSLGSLLCGVRTSEHQRLYVEGEEAVFFSTPEECAEVCKKMLADESLRLSIALRGHDRCVKDGRFNEVMLKEILAMVPTNESATRSA